jgi:hypothetical protein
MSCAFTTCDRERAGPYLIICTRNARVCLQVLLVLPEARIFRTLQLRPHVLWVTAQAERNPDTKQERNNRDVCSGEARAKRERLVNGWEGLDSFGSHEEVGGRPTLGKVRDVRACELGVRLIDEEAGPRTLDRV